MIYDTYLARHVRQMTDKVIYNLDYFYLTALTSEKLVAKFLNI